MSMQSRAQRMATGAEAQAELKYLLEQAGLFVAECGQENWLPSDMHAVLRQVHDDVTVRAARYHPDLFVFGAKFPFSFWDAKANTVEGTPNFTIEQACYQEQMARVRLGQRVAIAFRDTDRKWRAQWVQSLHVVANNAERRHEAAGSMTPYLLVAKLSTIALRTFLANY
jgi:hypothetical protein